MNVDIGIKSKLLFAFALILTTTLLASGIALTAFTKYSDALSSITQDSVPFMAESMALSQAGMQLSAEVPLLASSITLLEVDSHYNNIIASADNLESLLTSKTKAGAAQEPFNALSSGVKKVRQLGEKLETEVQQRISSHANTADATARIMLIQNNVDKQLLEIVDRASTRFVIEAEDIFGSNSDLVNELLKSHVGGMVRASRVQSQTSELISLMNDSLSLQFPTSIPDPVLAASIPEAGFSTDIAITPQAIIQPTADPVQISKDNLKKVKSNQGKAKILLRKNKSFLKKMDLTRIYKKDEAIAGFERINELAGVVFNLNASQRHPDYIESLILELNQVNYLLAKSLFSIVDTNKFLVFQSGQELRKSVDETLPALMKDNVENLVGLLELRAQLNSVGGILSHVPQANVATLKSLEAQFSVERSLIENTLSAVKNTEGVGSISDGFVTLFAETDPDTGIFHSRQNELLSEDVVTQIKDEFLSNQGSFVGHLMKQVSASQEQVELDSVNVTELIDSSRKLLVIVCIVSVFVTILVYWLLISRNILQRLLSIINALRSLASGDYSVEVDSRGSDELTSLAKTVEVFKHNGLEAQRLQEQQDIAEAQSKEQEHKQAEQQRLQHTKDLQRHEQEQVSAQERQREADILQQKVDKLLTAVSAAAKGDLAYPIDCSGDDVAGQMGKALDKLFSELRSSISGINDNATRLYKASESLTGLSVEMKEIASANTDNAKEASGLVSDVASSVDRVACATDNMTLSTKQISQNSSDAEAVASEAVELAKTTDLTVRKLAESSAGIGNVIKVITSIAEQTNLLALNATIEAARAGDAGKGFAVVANEVKELAKETAQATEQIESRIMDIQSDTESAVRAIQSISTIIDKVSGIQSTIANAVDEQSLVTKDIDSSIVQTASDTQAITAIIEGVADKAQLNQQASSDVNNAATDLSHMATQLQVLVSRFTASHDQRVVDKAA